MFQLLNSKFISIYLPIQCLWNYSNWKCLFPQADSLPYSDWQKLGLLKQRPSYDSGVYFSETCRPTQEEKVLMSDLDKRTGISVKEVALTKLAEPGDTKKYQSDNEIEQFIQVSYVLKLLFPTLEKHVFQ